MTATKFKVGDKVYSPHWGEGAVTSINSGAIYPVEVKWSDGNYECFSAQGQHDCEMADPEIDIVPIEEVKKEPKFEVGDHVVSRHFGKGVVASIEDSKQDEYPVGIRWLDGQFNTRYPDPEYDIIHDDEDEEDFNKKAEDAINPSHYKVEGLPEAIDIINHLMHREQYEGFLWGNILKYAYRFGRKGDKAETAGKIEWYAKQLKELCECEAEKEGGDRK